MQQQSNTYIILFSVALTVVLGGLLALAATSLKPAQQESIKLDTQKQILSAVVNLQGMKPEAVQAKYESQIVSLVVNYKGEEVKEKDGAPVVAEKVNIRKEYKKINSAEKLIKEANKLSDAAKADQKRKEAEGILEEVLLPVFCYKEDKSSDNVSAYILPTYGNGLWNNIWGYIALEQDLKTIKGVSFDHVGETPGLGARITDKEIQSRYEGTKIYDGGELVSVTMVKGEGNTGLNEHQVDGMSGATLTADGINIMLMLYFERYEPYLNRIAENAPAKPNGVALAN